MYTAYHHRAHERVSAILKASSDVSFATRRSRRECCGGTEAYSQNGSKHG